MNANDQNAILIFSRFAAEEAKVKNYANAVGKKGGNKLAGHLIQHTLDEAKKSGIPVYSFFSDKQKGNSFGERLANAIEEVFSKGFTNLIITGTDSPDISTALFQKAVKKLNHYGMVLGPSKDGGVYLIGINKKAYNRQAFLQIPWLSSAVFQSLKTYAANIGVAFSTEEQAEDIDSVSDLLEWKRTNKYPPLAILFATILAAYQKSKQVFNTLMLSTKFAGISILPARTTCYHLLNTTSFITACKID